MSVEDPRKTLDELARLRDMRAGTTDPLASRLLLDIITDLEAILPGNAQKGNVDAEN
jgi:hypothetical protein